jgi:plastocyanin
VLLGLTTGREIGIAACGACFIAFALACSFLIPRYRPNFPGRGVPLFTAVTVLFFVGMMTAILVLGHEPKEAKAGGGQPSSTASTQTTPSTGSQKIAVQETEFKITLPSTTLKAGSYEFDAQDKGKLGHDLVIAGNGVNTKTPVFNPGETQTLKVTLKPGKYDFYCSVPGHKQAGMNTEVTVT